MGVIIDGHFAPGLADKVLPMGPILKDTYAYLWYTFNIIPLIAFRENAVINLEGTEMRINHQINKMWKKGGMFTHLSQINLNFSVNMEEKIKSVN